MTSTRLLSGDLHVRPAGAADAEQLLRLHREGFDSAWTMRHWRWRYVDNPLRSTEVIGAFTADGRCLASFCGVPLPCRYDGATALVQRAGDVIVHPQLRTSVAGSQVLLRVANQFCSTFGGGDRRIVFGFPEPGLQRTIVRHCRFEVIAGVALLQRAVDAPVAACARLRVATDADVPADADGFLQAWGREVATGIVRDRRYLQWRYRDNPHGAYSFVSARSSSGALRGLGVLRHEPLAPGSLAAVEWIVPRGDREATGAMVAAASERARALDRTDLVCSFAPSSPEFIELQRDHGFHVRMTPYQFVCRPYHAGITRRFLFENWFHGFGDLDFT
ncbi:MAG: GNAT family N-acetyltransferase [Planctomycetes bacterium]|nr:GNAT family N-acetyltransferase [Planctomycetota bacterium]